MAKEMKQEFPAGEPRTAPVPLAADQLIVDLLESYPQAAEVLRGFRLPCEDCVVAEKETLAEGCQPHGRDPQAGLRALKKALQEKARDPRNTQGTLHAGQGD